MIILHNAYKVVPSLSFLMADDLREFFDDLERNARDSRRVDECPRPKVSRRDYHSKNYISEIVKDTNYSIRGC